VNVAGTSNVNNLAKSIAGLKRYHYVSTCYVAGKREGLIMETELAHNAGFRNHYEETKYLAETEVEALTGLLARLSQGMAIRVVAHHMGFVASVSDRVVCLNSGRKIAEGSAADIQSNEAVIASYLGEG